jgi:hypothetical protein
LHRCTECLYGAFDKFAPPGILFCSREFWSPKGVMEPSTTHNTIRPNTGGHSIETGGQDGRQASPFTFLGNRSTATRPCASGGGQNDRLHPTCDKLTGNFSPNTPHVIEAAEITYRHKQVIEETPNGAVPLQIP